MWQRRSGDVVDHIVRRDDACKCAPVCGPCFHQARQEAQRDAYASDRSHDDIRGGIHNDDMTFAALDNLHDSLPDWIVIVSDNVMGKVG